MRQLSLMFIADSLFIERMDPSVMSGSPTYLDIILPKQRVDLGALTLVGYIHQEPLAGNRKQVKRPPSGNHRRNPELSRVSRKTRSLCIEHPSYFLSPRGPLRAGGAPC